MSDDPHHDARETPQDPSDEGLIRSARQELDGQGVLLSPLEAPASMDERPGARIGRFKLLQEIGEGGFGTVWMAEQQEPVKRKVALKIIKLGMDTKQVVARFEAERQALAMMEHPNIARVHDGGVSESGRPYFVMELVKGVPVTEYCDVNNLATAERVRLFTSICKAVQHAHQKGVIHRDLKPSNVLVTLHDGVPVPKVIDFGIAKATNQELTSRTLFTEFRQFIGTPEYMSPEQAEMSGLDIDTRSDVYSLGVLLYELLTGSTPFDARELRTAGLQEIQRIIREEEPPRPSTRVSTLGEQLTVVASHRQCDGSTLRRDLRGDLDWIVMRALEKDRTRRYETADALATDLARYLEDEPVLAGPPGAGYRLRKALRRHRRGVALAGAVAFVLLLAMVLITRGTVRARMERERALQALEMAQFEAERAREAELQAEHARAESVRERLRAESEAHSSRAINDFFVDMLASADPLARLYSPHSMDGMQLSGGGTPRTESVPQMLRSASAQIEGTFAGKPLLEASMRETVGTTLAALSLPGEAIPHLEKALALRVRELGEQDPETLRSKMLLAGYIRGARGIALAREALEGMRDQLGEDDAETLTVARGLARLLYFSGDVEAGRALFEETLAAQRRALGPTHPDTLVTAHLLAFSSLWEGWPGGEELALEVHAFTEGALEPDHPFAIAARAQLAWWRLEAHRTEEALTLFRAALEPCERILGTEHWLTGMTRVGAAISMRGRTADPQSAASAEREALLATAAASSVNGAYKDLAREVHAEMRYAQGDRKGAIQELRAALDEVQRGTGRGSVNTLLARHRLACATWLAADGDPQRSAEAEQLFDRVAAGLTAGQRPVAPELARCARAILAHESTDAAELARALEWSRAAAAAESDVPRAARASATLGAALWRSGDPDAALGALERSLELDAADPLAWSLLARVHAAREHGATAAARAALANAVEALARPDFVEDLERRMFVERARRALE